MIDAHFLAMLEDLLRDKEARMKSAHRHYFELWLAQVAAKSAIEEAA
jgi:hypothetical protein